VRAFRLCGAAASPCDMTKFLHTMIRVADPDATIAFFKLFGVE